MYLLCTAPPLDPALLHTQDGVVCILKHQLEGGRGQLAIVGQHFLTEQGIPLVGWVNHVPHLAKGAPGLAGRGGEGRGRGEV